MKLVMLMALTSVSRVSELTKLNPELMEDSTDQVKFHIAGLTKTKRPNNPHLAFTFEKYKLDDSLDVVQCLRHYLKVTDGLRTTLDQKQHLLIAYTKPHKPIVPCSLARWLKCVMAMAKIDTNIYKAHSTRAASASKAVAQGLSTNQILSYANWSGAATFNRFYRKPIVSETQSSYQQKVVSLQL